jgi:hypothetical protein
MATKYQEPLWYKEYVKQGAPPNFQGSDYYDKNASMDAIARLGRTAQTTGTTPQNSATQLAGYTQYNGQQPTPTNTTPHGGLDSVFANAPKPAAVDPLEALKKQIGSSTANMDWMKELSGMSAGTGGFKPSVIASDAKKAELRGADDLAAKYGLTNFKYDDLEALFKGAAQKEFGAKADAQESLINRMDQGFSDVALQREMLQQRELANRIQSGASQGMSTVNAMLEARDSEQQFSDQRLEALAERRNIDAQLGAAEARAMVDADSESTARKQYLGQLGSNLYATDTESYLGQLGHNAQINAASLGAQGQAYVGDQTLKGSIAGANATRDAASITGNANIRGQELYRDAVLGGAMIGANAEQTIAGMNFDQGKMNMLNTVMMEMGSGKWDLKKPEQYNQFMGMMSDILGLDIPGIKIPEVKKEPIVPHFPIGIA